MTNFVIALIVLLGIGAGIGELGGLLGVPNIIIFLVCFVVGWFGVRPLMRIIGDIRGQD